MGSLPLHPSVVHVPLGVAVVLPLVAIGLALACWRGWLTPRCWAIVAALQAVVLAGALIAMNTGESDEELVEDAVGESAIESHEEAAELFTWAAGLVLAMAVAAAAMRRERVANALRWLTAAGTVAVLVLGIRVGHQGGELVYERGAASVHVAGSGQTSPAASRGHHDDEDEDDD